MIKFWKQVLKASSETNIHIGVRKGLRIKSVTYKDQVKHISKSVSSSQIMWPFLTFVHDCTCTPLLVSMRLRISCFYISNIVSMMIMNTFKGIPRYYTNRRYPFKPRIQIYFFLIRIMTKILHRERRRSYFRIHLFTCSARVPFLRNVFEGVGIVAWVPLGAWPHCEVLILYCASPCMQFTGIKEVEG